MTVWAKAWSAARRLFGGGGGDGTTGPDRPRPPTRTERRRWKRAGELDPQTFISVTSGLGTRDHQARLHVFSLTDFRKAAGPKWTKLEPLVGIASSQIIRRNLDPAKDLYTRLDAETACVVMPGTDRATAHALVATIAKELSSYLFGAQLVGMRRPQIVTANVALEEIFGPGARHGADAIKAAVATAGALIDSAAVTPADAGQGPPRRTTLAAMLSPEEDAARLKQEPHVFAISGSDRHGCAAEEPLWTEIRRRGEMQVMQAEERGPKAEEQVLDAEAQPSGGELQVMELGARGNGPARQDPMAAVPPDAGRAMTAESVLTLVWTPTWVTSSRGIGAFHARVIREDRDGAPPLEGPNAYRAASPVEILTLDRFVATQAAHELTSIYFSRQRTGLTVPIHWMSLAPQWCDCIRLPFEECPPQARRKLLKIEIFGLTDSLPPAIRRNLAEPLAKLGCDVIVRLPLSAAAMVSSLNSVRAIGVDLAELPEGERVGDDALLARLVEFRDTARQARTACYVWSVRRRQLIAGIARAGFSLINGPGVMCDVSRPFPSGTLRG